MEVEGWHLRTGPPQGLCQQGLPSFCVSYGTLRLDFTGGATVPCLCWGQLCLPWACFESRGHAHKHFAGRADSDEPVLPLVGDRAPMSSTTVPCTQHDRHEWHCMPGWRLGRLSCSSLGNRKLQLHTVRPSDFVGVALVTLAVTDCPCTCCGVLLRCTVNWMQATQVCQ